MRMYVLLRSVKYEYNVLWGKMSSFFMIQMLSLPNSVLFGLARWMMNSRSRGARIVQSEERRKEETFTCFHVRVFSILSIEIEAQTMVFSGIVQAIGNVNSMTKKSNIKLWDGSTGVGYELEVRCENFFADDRTVRTTSKRAKQNKNARTLKKTHSTKDARSQ